MICWAILCVVLKIIGIFNWEQATSFLWLPAGAFISAITIIYGTALYGAKKKAEREKKEKPSCANCLYRRTQKILKEEKCFGESHEEPKIDGICKYWIRVKD